MKSSNPIINGGLTGIKKKETLLDVRENIHEDSQSEDLVSLDGTQKDTSEKLSAGVHGKTFDYQLTKKQVKKNDGE